jgi:DNA ligase (NAD+)
MKRVIKTLETAISYHREKYYSGNPELTDAEYDRLEEELREIDPSNPTLNSVGSNRLQSSQKHEIWMPSIQKMETQEAVTKWLGDSPAVYSFKLDGSSMALYFQNGRFVKALTRGTGYEGEDRTDAMSYVNFPKQNAGDYVVWGEVVIDKQAFPELIEEMKRLGLEPVKSIRNAVAGLLNRKSNKELCRYLSFVAHNYWRFDENFQMSHSEKLSYLESAGWEVVNWSIFVQTQTGCIVKESKRSKHSGDENVVFAYINNEMNKLEFNQYMFDTFNRYYRQLVKTCMIGDEPAIPETEMYPYLTDGIVITKDQRTYDLNDKTSKFYRWNCCFKFETEEATTRVTGINWQVGRTGKVTPVVLIEPVELSGCTIERATAHNAKNIIDSQIGLNAMVTITRSKEVIPKIVGVPVPVCDTDVVIPHACPVCGETLTWSNTKVDLMCTSQECIGQIITNLTYFASTMEMENVAEATVTLLVEHGLIRNRLDFYDLTTNDLLNLPRFGVDKAEKIVSSISESIRKFTVEKFIVALGIPGIGKDVTKKILAFGLEATRDDLPRFVSQTSGIGDVLEATIRVHINDIIRMVSEVKEKLKDLIPAETSVKAVCDGSLSGMKFVLSGSFPMPKKALEELITKHGGIIVSSVTKDLDYLVTNETGTSKYNKAVSLGKKIINDDELNQMLI